MEMNSWEMLSLVVVMGLYTGVQNFVAGGGTFITFPVFLLMGLDPVTATMSNALGLFPNQLTSAYWSYPESRGIDETPLSRFLWVSLLGGGVGAFLLSISPTRIFLQLVPWLVMFATLIYAWGSLRRTPMVDKEEQSHNPHRARWALVGQFVISIYGGYFAAGIGFLMLALLTLMGQGPKTAIHTKNVLVVGITLLSFAIFSVSTRINWPVSFALAGGTLVGSWMGSRLLHHIRPLWLKAYVLILGTGLTIWLFLK